MKKIALVCSFGLSTSLLTQAMERAASEKGLDVKITAIGTSELDDEAEGVDVFLLAPQVRYLKSSVEKYGRPVGIIEGPIYALADGGKALNQAVQLMKDRRSS